MPCLILFNKPFGVLCQFRDKDGRPVLADYISRTGVYPAGRLDHDSEGLLLLTDDGILQSRISDPRWKLPKTYWVQVEGEISDHALERLAKGVELNDGPTLPAEAQRMNAPPLWERTPPIRYRANIPTSWLSLTIREGRNRQVRRMTAAVGFPTLRLVRAAVGTWEIGSLQPGEWQQVALEASARTALSGSMEAPEDRPRMTSRAVRQENSLPARPVSAASDPRPQRRSPSPRPSTPHHSPTPSSRKGHGS
ncbi:MAG: rluE [Moraxellaceae bacterium]|nr:rluE [Moraxellaceae bacterium]